MNMINVTFSVRLEQILHSTQVLPFKKRDKWDYEPPGKISFNLPFVKRSGFIRRQAWDERSG